MQQKASHQTKANRQPEVNPVVDRKIANRVMTSARECAEEETNVIFGTSWLAKRLGKCQYGNDCKFSHAKVAKAGTAQVPPEAVKPKKAAAQKREVTRRIKWSRLLHCFPGSQK